MIPAHVWADDLTGAAEVADLLAHRTGRAVVLSLAGDPAPPGALVVHDLDLRHSPEADARAAVAARLARIAPGDRVFVKLDSQLNGPVAGCLAAMVDGGRRTLLSAANPALGRVTNEGVHRVAGHEGVTTTAIPDLLADVPHRVIDRLSLARPGPEPGVLAADAATQGDLDALARHAVEHGLDLAGGAALLAALLGPGAARSGAAPPAGRRLVAVIGSTEAAARAQVAAVRERERVEVIEVVPGSPDVLAAAADALQRGRHVVLVRAAGPEALAALGSAAAEVIGAQHPPDTSALLTGGHTARLVLDRLDVRTLTVIPDRPGATVRLTTPVGLTVFTKPGSYGGAHALGDLLDSLPPVPHEELR